MRGKKTYIFGLSWICALLLLASCSSDENDGQVLSGANVNLTLHVGVPGVETKAEDATNVPDQEKIEQLRIIVVDKETNEVEYNQFCLFSRPESSYDISVKKNGTKLVYLLGNTENVLSDLGSITTWNANQVDDKTYDVSDINVDPLPFTSKYEIEVKEEDVSKECYIAIAAVKFSFEFENAMAESKEGDDDGNNGNDDNNNTLTVSSVKISRLATESYLLPHPANKWEDWIQAFEEDKNAIIKEYEVPSTTADGTELHQDMTLTLDEKSASNIAPGSTYIVPTFYANESKYDNLFPDDTGQHYMLELVLNGQTYYKSIANEDGDELTSLFRSTHVKIKVIVKDIKVEEGDVEIWARKVPWEEGNTVVGGLEPVEVDDDDE